MVSSAANVVIRAVAMISVLALGACGDEQSAIEDVSSDIPGQWTGALASGTLTLNDIYYVTNSSGQIGAYMYDTATSSTVIRRVAPNGLVKIVVAAPTNGRYRVDHAGNLGWISGQDLTLAYPYNSTLSADRINALARGRGAMGFTYWWSNARWPATVGATTFPSDNRGSCVGACPSCTHSATPVGGTEYGADCSGFLSTVWGFPDFDPDTNPTNNGFATSAYNSDTANWSTVANSAALPGDAMVQHVVGGMQHIFLVATARNAAGFVDTLECRSCDFGCMKWNRDASNSSGWHAIRRTGW